MVALLGEEAAEGGQTGYHDCCKSRIVSACALNADRIKNRHIDLPTVVSMELHIYSHEVSGMLVRELTTVVRTIAKMIVIMTSEKIQPRANFFRNLIWVPQSMLIGIAMTRVISCG